MILVLSFLAGCQQDLLLLGDVTGLRNLSATVTPVALPARAPVPAPLPAPTDVQVADAGTAEPAVPDAAPAAAAAAEPKFNPISVPEGPREGDGVRWEGVKVKGRATGPQSTRRETDQAR